MGGCEITFTYGPIVIPLAMTKKGKTEWRIFYYFFRLIEYPQGVGIGNVWLNYFPWNSDCV